MEKCPNCDQVLENGTTKCPNCGNEIIKENVIEEVQVDPNSVISLNDEPKTEEPIEQQETQSNPASQEPVLETTNPEVTNQELPTPVEVQQQQPQIVEETAVINSDLETISVDASNMTLEEEKPKEVIIEIPEMPEPTIAEINPDLLGNRYDEIERINNEKIEAKRQEELAELERKRQEEEEKRQAQAQAGKPDLLAGRETAEVNIELAPKKKKGKIGKIILILLILAVIACATYYFLVLGKN